MTYMDQSRRDEVLTASLPAWAWRMVLYSIEHMVDYRSSVGHDEVAESYQSVQQKLAMALGVGYSGDLPIGRDTGEEEDINV